MRGSKSILIAVGLKFKSLHFSMDAEVKEVREESNQLDVILTPSDGHAFVDKGWNLQHTKWGFERGDYFVLPPEPPISVF